MDAGAGLTEMPLVELLYCADCPSHGDALRQLQRLLGEQQLDPGMIVLRQLVTREEAVAARFIGSPTIRVNGVDVVDPADEPPGISCRVYVRRNGRYDPLPDDEDIRVALGRATRHPAGEGTAG